MSMCSVLLFYNIIGYFSHKQLIIIFILSNVLICLFNMGIVAEYLFFLLNIVYLFMRVSRMHTHLLCWKNYAFVFFFNLHFLCTIQSVKSPTAPR